jgi:hypothetical protein
MLWRRSRQRQKTLGLDSDEESEIDSVADPAPFLVPSPVSSPVLTPDQGLNRVCIGCSESKSILAAFPSRRVTAACNHEPGYCRRCLERRINVDLAQDGWDQVRCPENGCNSRLEAADVQEFASLDNNQR